MLDEDSFYDFELCNVVVFLQYCEVFNMIVGDFVELMIFCVVLIDATGLVSVLPSPRLQSACCVSEVCGITAINWTLKLVHNMRRLEWCLTRSCSEL